MLLGLVAGLIVLGAIGAFAAAGVAAVVSGENGDTVKGQSSQQAVGSVSARAPSQQILPESQGGNTAPAAGGTENPESGSVLGKQQAGNGSGGGGKGRRSLPFTGLLAIPVLLVGAGALTLGAALRTRVRPSAELA